MPITFVTDILARHFNQPVEDRTGLTGYYDFTFKWAEGGMTGRTEVHERELTMPVGGGLPPALLAAMEEQLGLKLDQQTVPQTVLVIDRAEKLSSARVYGKRVKKTE